MWRRPNISINKGGILHLHALHTQQGIALLGTQPTKTHKTAVRPLTVVLMCICADKSNNTSTLTTTRGSLMEDSQRRIQEFALGGVPSPLHSPPFPPPFFPYFFLPFAPFFSPPLPIRSMIPLKPARVLGERCKRGPGRSPTENEFGAP